MVENDTTLIYIPGDGGETRTLVLSPARARRWRRGAWAAGVLLCLGAVTWVVFAVRSLRVSALEGRLAELEAERIQTAELASTLQDLEEQYGQLRALFGSAGEGIESEVWLPPPAGTRGGSPANDDDPTPTSWPLTERGFVTQPLLAGVDAQAHPGLDIAIPTDSYIRAAAAGEVVEAGEDPIYGRFLVLDHGNGYRTRYAHANLLLVPQGAAVRRHEIIALSGSTGRSTAPHLHFEILLDGQAVDPLTLVRQPA